MKGGRLPSRASGGRDTGDVPRTPGERAVFEKSRRYPRPSETGADDSARRSGEEQPARLPPSRAFLVSGRIDRIEPDGARFRLRFSDDRTLPGRLGPGVEVEELRRFRGRQVTVLGQVHFHADGRARVLVARQFGKREKGHAIFDRMPEGFVPGSPVISKELAEKAANFDWSRLEGLWEIDQSPEEVLAQIREMRSPPVEP